MLRRFNQKPWFFRLIEGVIVLAAIGISAACIWSVHTTNHHPKVKTVKTTTTMTKTQAMHLVLEVNVAQNAITQYYDKQGIKSFIFEAADHSTGGNDWIYGQVTLDSGKTVNVRILINTTSFLASDLETQS